MKYLVIVILSILFAGCITINRTIVLPVVHDTIQKPCGGIHLEMKDDWYRSPQWFRPDYFRLPQIGDTNWLIIGNSIDTLKYSNDSTFIIRSYPIDSVGVRKSKKGG